MPEKMSFYPGGTWGRPGLSIFAPSAFHPKGPNQAGLVSVDYGSMSNYSQFGPNSYVLKIPWAEIEPQPGQYVRSGIDAVLNANPGRRMTLRPQAGGSAPQWLKDLVGNVDITNNQLGLGANIACFWDPRAIAAWDGMIRQLGAWYDDDLRIPLVSSDFAMTLYSEPLILGGHNPSAIAMYNLGLNKNSHRFAMTESTKSCMEAFPRTYVEFAGHGDWQQATASGVVRSWPDARDLLLEMCLDYKDHLVLSDYGLDDTDYASSYQPAASLAVASNWYSFMRTRKATPVGQGGGHIGFQLTLGAGQEHFGYERQGGAQRAFEFGADYVEHASWGSIAFDGTVPEGGAEITRLDNQLKATAGYQ